MLEWCQRRPSRESGLSSSLSSKATPFPTVSVEAMLGVVIGIHGLSVRVASVEAQWEAETPNTSSSNEEPLPSMRVSGGPDCWTFTPI